MTPKIKAAAVTAAVLVCYTAALLYRHEQVPPGLNNDAAEEALRGLYLLDHHRFEVITFAIGNSAETLYLYLMGFAAKLAGCTVFAIQAVSWVVAIACIWLTARLTERYGVPRWIPLIAGAGSLWMFHYAHSGLRAISAPFFLAAFALLLDRAERKPGDRRIALLCGAVLGLGIYSYTALRVVPVAFLAYALWRLVKQRAPLLKCYATVVAGAAVVSIPNLIFFVQHPTEFLTRGSYVLLGSAVDQVMNVFWSIVFPFYYPDYYRNIGGPTYTFDGVSAALTASGRNPVHFVLALAILLGLWQSRKAPFLLLVWAVAAAVLGLGGPSLTRMLILWPVHLLFASLGLAWMVQRYPNFQIPLLLILVGAGATDVYSYMALFGNSPAAVTFYGAAATPIGENAASLAAQGERVLCIVSKDSGVVQYLTHDAGGRVKTIEFYMRPIDPGQISLAEFNPNILLIENAPNLRGYTATFPAAWRTASDRFETVRFPRR